MQPSAGLLFTLALSLCLDVNAGPLERRDEVSLQNGRDAINRNARFRTLSPMSPCETDEVACVSDMVARCDQGRFDITRCPSHTVCRAYPNRGSPGTSIGCMSVAENTMRIRATGVDYTPPEPEDPSQSSLTLDPAVISTGFQSNGQDNITDTGQVPSRVSSNNWINFCKTTNKELTNGRQVPGGSCNPAPIGVIPSSDNMPSAKFIYPPNLATVPRNETFTVRVAISHLDTGWFTNPQKTYMAAPQEVNAGGDVIGHSHIVIDSLAGGFNQTTPTDPKMFVFFQALNAPAVDGVWTCNVTNGLGPGYYRIAVVHTAANHQPIALPIARRGATFDMVYFSVV